VLRQPSVRSQPRTEVRGGFLRLGVPAALDWVLLAYALLAVIAGSAFAAIRIHADYQQTLDAERDSLRAVTAALESGVLAILEDSVRAGTAGTGEAIGMGGLDRAPRLALTKTLRRELAGGAYIRSVFLADPGRFMLVGRTGAEDLPAAPAWLRAATAANAQTWVGAPMTDPERPGRLVVPVARRASLGRDSLGWAGALLSFTEFAKVARQFGSQVDTLGLLTDDGIVLASVTNGDIDRYAGAKLMANPLFRRAVRAGGRGIVEGYGPILGTQMIYGYDPVRGFPIYVAAGRSRDSVLAGWYARRRVGISAAVAFSALVVVMTAFLGHYMRALRARERDYRALFNSAQFSVFLLEADRFVDANRTAASMFGLESERAAIGLAPWELSPPLQPNGRSSKELARERIRTALREGGTTFEWMHQRADAGTAFPAEVDLSSLSTGHTTLTLAVVHDVTIRKRAEEDLRHLSAELMRLQDEERRRIGRELHDSTGQSLAALELGLAQLARHASSLSAGAREQLDLCAELARRCSAEIRTASYLLHPPLLDELGLVSTLRWLADGLRSRSGLEVRLELPQQLERLPPEQELALFRVAQEALTNVHRHSASPWVGVRLRGHSGGLVLEVQDAGRGIPEVLKPDSPGSLAAGVGVAGMRERIRELGGTLEVESTSNGTLIRACLPLADRGGGAGGRPREALVGS
jgi:PAS domain S-box-containing protein